MATRLTVGHFIMFAKLNIIITPETKIVQQYVSTKIKKDVPLERHHTKLINIGGKAYNQGSHLTSDIRRKIL